MSSKVTATTIVVVIFLATLVIVFLRFNSPEDSWICQNGQWVKHGNPSTPAPTENCGSVTEEKKESADKTKTISEDENNDTLGIKVSYPSEGNITATPVEVVGYAKGIWFFEGSFPAKVTDSKGKVIGEAPATALGEWMTSESVPFRAIIDIPENFVGPATVILSEDDPSGQKEVKKLEIPVTIEKSGIMRTKIYLNSMYFDPDSEQCDKVYPIERVTTLSKGVAKAAIEELLKGVTEEEKDGGYYTSINSDVKLNSINLASGVIKIDFDKKLEEGVGGACRTEAIRAQIEETLKQFPSVKNVVISVEGKTEGILQP